MKKPMFKRLFSCKLAILICAVSLLTANMSAQDSITIAVAPLFEYPEPPAEITNVNERSSWVLKHFWDPMDFKSGAVAQIALNHAFSVYIMPSMWAPRDEVMASLNELIAKLEKNPVLLTQFTKAAEELLYGERAKMWSDELYIPFLEAYIKNKKITQPRKERYAEQLRLMQNTLIGKEAPAFDYKDINGTQQRYRPDHRYSIIEFGNPDCSDCRIDKIRMSSNTQLENAIKNDRVAVYFINIFPEEGWESKMGTFPHTWQVGSSENIDDIYDLRITPSFYVIGPDKKIVLKNVDSDQAVNYVLAELLKEKEAQ